MVGLGDLAGRDFQSYANGVSGDGSIVVGAGDTFDGTRAFIWDESHGIRDLNDVLVTDYGLDLSGWDLKVANAISDDGQTIVGMGIHNGNQEAFVAMVPEPSTGLLLGGGFVLLAARRRGRAYNG